MQCEGVEHFRRFHGIETSVLGQLKDAYYRDFPNRFFEKYPSRFLLYYSSLTDQSPCEALRELLSSYPQAYEGLTIREQDNIKRLLNTSLPALIQEVEAERESQRLSLEQNRSITESLIIDFLDNLDDYTLVRLGLTGDELLLLIYTHPLMFSTRLSSRFDTFMYLYQNLKTTSSSFDSAVRSALKLREEAVANAPSRGWPPAVIRVMYLVENAATEALAKRILDVACARGESSLFARIDSQGGYVPGHRRDFLDSIAVDHSEFREYFMSLWNSRACRLAFPEFSKRSGDSWEKSMRY
jgi:hypothetical protein